MDWSENGYARAACVDLSQPCDQSVDWTCTSADTYHACFQGYVALDSYGWGYCDEERPLCVQFVDAEGRGQVDCALSDIPCPGGRAAYCLGNAVHTCGVGGYPVARNACAPDEHCVEGVDAEGNDVAACALSDVPCPAGRESVCFGDTVAECTVYGTPVAARHCPDYDNFCVDFDHHPTDGSAYLGDDGEYRMQRGGAFEYEHIYISVSRRPIADATQRSYNLGFRCVR